MAQDELTKLRKELAEVREITARLLCQSAALIHVLKAARAGDGEPILNSERFQMFQKKLDEEFAARGLRNG